ncbi:MAG: DUF6492 family protein [Aestuariibacter sp.]
MSIGAVLPLSIRGSYDVDDLGRVEILFRTLAAYSEPGLFSKFLIVTPASEVDAIKDKLQPWSQFNPDVISEEVLIPELQRHRHMRGWRKQQLVKIAAYAHFEDDFYMTFDADVICLKRLTEDDLVKNGKSLLQYEPRTFHPKWWRSSARLLKMSPNIGDTSVGMHVTPAILSTKIAHGLTEELTQLWQQDWPKMVCELHNPKAPKNWRFSRIRMMKWTEYSLYYLYALKKGLLHRYHFSAGTEQHPQLLLVHDSHPYEEWKPQKNFSADCPGLFCVVGSKSRLEPEMVWRKIKEFVPERA